MEIRRVMAAGAVGVALVASGVGCGAITDKATEKATEKVIEESSNCEDVDIDTGGGFSGNCDGESIDVDVDGDAELPEGWPAELAPPEGAKIVFATNTSGTLSVTAGLDGEVDAVTDGIATQLEEAGYTVDDQSSADNGGVATASIRATSDAYQALVAVTEVENGLDGNLTISYTLTPPTGG